MNSVKTEIAVTDLTRMRRGRVCIAGYDRDLNCIRPVMPPTGIPETSLHGPDGAPSIAPFAVVSLVLIEHRPQPPHTEDWVHDPATVKFVRMVRPERRQALLDQTLFPGVSAIFEQEINDDPGHSVADGVGPRSVGTIVPQAIHRVEYSTNDDGSFGFKLRFRSDDRWYRLRITDLAWTRHCQSLVTEQHGPEVVADEMTSKLKRSKLYLRVGLSRGWAKHPGRCFLQLNAIHAFPDFR